MQDCERDDERWKKGGQRRGGWNKELIWEKDLKEWEFVAKIYIPTMLR